MIHYLIHSAILLTLSLVFYWVFLKKETFYKLNRIFLISSFIAALLIPLISIPSSLSLRLPISEQEVPIIDINNSITPVTPRIPSTNKINESTPPTPPSPIKRENVTAQWNWQSIIWMFYLAGVAIFILTFIIQFIIILLKKSKLESIKDGRYTIYELTDDSSPFSFFNWIFINPGLYEPDTFDQILEHEKIHVSQSHYIDKLLAEFAVIIFWFNPFAWMYRKAIANNLEFLTDSEILKQGIEPQSYQMSLLKVSVPQHSLTLATSYNESFLAQRIRMMNERRSSAKSSWKYLLTIPLILITMASLNAVQVSPSSNDNELISSDQTIKNEHDSTSDACPDQNDKIKRKDKDKNKHKVNRYTTDGHSQQKSTERFNINENNNDNPVINDNTNDNINLNINTNINLNLDKIVNTTVNTLTNQTTSKGHHLGLYNNHNVRPGHWKGYISEDEFCFFMNNSNKKRGYNASYSDCIPKSSINNIPTNEVGEIRIVRDPGTLIFSGQFLDNEGQGEFEFIKNTAFVSFLNENNITSVSDQEIYHMFLHETSRELITKVIQKGYRLNNESLIEMGMHGIRTSNLDSYDEILNDYNVQRSHIEKIIEMAIHGVDKTFADDIKSMNLGRLTIDRLIEAKIHGVHSHMIEELKEAGYDNINMDKVIEFAIHGIDSADIDSYQKVGYDNLSPDKMIEFKIHGIDEEFISGISEQGYDNIDPNRLIEFKIHGVTPTFINEIRKLGYTDIRSSRLVEFRIHGVTPELINTYQKLGYTDVRASRLVEFVIHDVSPEFITNLQSLGYTEVSPNKLVEARIHGITPEFIKGFQNAGYKDLSISKLIELSIHDISPIKYNGQ